MENPNPTTQSTESLEMAELFIVSTYRDRVLVISMRKEIKLAYPSGFQRMRRDMSAQLQHECKINHSPDANGTYATQPNMEFYKTDNSDYDIKPAVVRFPPVCDYECGDQEDFPNRKNNAKRHILNNCTTDL
ncbi:unnamed protein product [Clavelina lepadiformis]|uniref:Uncharacterized protein n=1 Tax=Clavelina lepadiformis TaxID=159417 RepID=A0ABP0G9H5_CLALP